MKHPMSRVQTVPRRIKHLVSRVHTEPRRVKHPMSSVHSVPVLMEHAKTQTILGVQSTNYTPSDTQQTGIISKEDTQNGSIMQYGILRYLCPPYADLFAYPLSAGGIRWRTQKAQLCTPWSTVGGSGPCWVGSRSDSSSRSRLIRLNRIHHRIRSTSFCT
jgi:hypothetical protein